MYLNVHKYIEPFEMVEKAWGCGTEELYPKNQVEEIIAITARFIPCIH
jgi:hypothetical protein